MSMPASGFRESSSRRSRRSRNGHAGCIAGASAGAPEWGIERSIEREHLVLAQVSIRRAPFDAPVGVESEMAKVLVLYYSAYGHIEAMAEAVAQGAREAGG